MAREDRTLELIEAARDIFIRYGYKKATLDDLADVVGMTKSSLYHYFSSKEDLFKKVAEELFARDVALMDRTLNTAGTIDEALVKLQSRMKERVVQVHPNASELIGEMTSIFPLIKDVFERTNERFIELLQNRLDRAVEEKELNPLPSREIAVILLMILRNALVFRRHAKMMKEMAQNWEHYIDIILSPYRTRSASL